MALSKQRLQIREVENGWVLDYWLDGVKVENASTSVAENLKQALEIAGELLCQTPPTSPSTSP